MEYDISELYSLYLLLVKRRRNRLFAYNKLSFSELTGSEKGYSKQSELTSSEKGYSKQSELTGSEKDYSKQSELTSSEKDYSKKQNTHITIYCNQQEI